MGHLIVITTPDLAPGFELAGVETRTAEKPEEAQALVRELLDGEEASLIAVHQDLLAGADSRLQRQIDSSYRPIVIAIPGGPLALPTGRRRRDISELIRRTVGFHITFGTEPPRAR